MLIVFAAADAKPFNSAVMTWPLIVYACSPEIQGQTQLCIRSMIVGLIIVTIIVITINIITLIIN